MARLRRIGGWGVGLGWALVAAAGCAGTPATDSPGVQVSPVSGARSTTLAAPLEDAYEASFWALQDLGFLIVGREMDALQGSVQARTADRIQVDVRLRRSDKGRTIMVVNAGPLHGRVANAVVEAVGEELGG